MLLYALFAGGLVVFTRARVSMGPCLCCTCLSLWVCVLFSVVGACGGIWSQAGCASAWCCDGCQFVIVVGLEFLVKVFLVCCYTCCLQVDLWFSQGRASACIHTFAVLVCLSGVASVAQGARQHGISYSCFTLLFAIVGFQI